MATQSASVTAKPRSELGSRANKRLRDSGFIPGVIYGHKEAVVPVTLPKKEVAGYLDKGAHVFDIALDGKSEKVLVKEVQYDHLGQELLHVDFARVSLDERVEVTVPLELKGEPKGEAEGGVLQQIVAELELECLVTEIPDAIRHALAARDFGRAANLIELAVPEMRRSRQEATLLGWLEALPDELVRCRPVLNVHFAGTLLQSGQLDGVEARLRDAER